jgi:hypothetical protein
MYPYTRALLPNKSRSSDPCGYAQRLRNLLCHVLAAALQSVSASSLVLCQPLCFVNLVFAAAAAVLQDAVSLCDESGHEFARGLSNFDSKVRGGPPVTCRVANTRLVLTVVTQYKHRASVSAAAAEMSFQVVVVAACVAPVEVLIVCRVMCGVLIQWCRRCLL